MTNYRWIEILNQEEEMTNYRKHFSTLETPQSQPIPGTSQVENSAGGYTWAVNDWTRLRRFLILGCEGNTYYATEQKLTVENAQAVARCIGADGQRVVNELVEISDKGRAPKNDPALFVLAMCASVVDEATRKAAFAALPKVARIGTHLFHFVNYVEGFRGWGGGLRRAVARWYSQKEPDALAMQLIKYQQRDGWSHRDMLRLAHPGGKKDGKDGLYKWVVGKSTEDAPLHPLLDAFEQLQKAEKETEAAKIVADYKLPMECVPTNLRGAKVWRAVLPHLGLTALIRNLGNLSRLEVIAPGSVETASIIKAITDPEKLSRARIHPIVVLAALCTYKEGKGIRGSHKWPVSAKIVDALDAAFYLAFKNIEPTGKRFVLALDVSGSMGSGEIAGVPGLTPRIGAAAMALVTARTEANYEIIAFQRGIVPLTISPRQRLDDVVTMTDNLNFGRTDCAQPMLWAIKNKVQADAFYVFTDSKTWAGKIHPSQALVQYRKQFNIPAKLIVVGMVSNGFTIADPNDAGQMDVVGFDTATPEIMRGFVQGEL